LFLRSTKLRTFTGKGPIPKKRPPEGTWNKVILA
jgi:hypothetical protein